MMGFGNSVVAALAAAVSQLPMSGGQNSRDEVIQTFHTGMTDGDMTMIGHITQYDCVMGVTGNARYCAVNFQPDGVLDGSGTGTGMCVGVGNCGATGARSGLPHVVTARVNAGTAPARPPSTTVCPNGLPPPCSGPLHYTHENICVAMRSYADGIDGITGGNEAVIQSSGISKADCVSSQDYAGSPYCAVNFYPVGDGVNPSGRCMGVLPPCGAIVPTSGTDTARLPIDDSQPCTWSPSGPTMSPPPAPLPVPPPPAPPPPVIGVPIGQQSLLCADGSLQVCPGGSQHRAVFCRADLDYDLGPAAAGSVCAEDHQAACSCECCTCADGLLPTCQEAIVPADRCDDAELMVIFNDINTVCCAGVDCSNGPPVTCNRRCADVMIDAWHTSACKTALQLIMGDTIASFVNLCEHPTDEIYTDVDDKYSCSYTELINLVLECTVAEEHDCSSTCIVHMRPFLQQCGEVMSGMISSMQPAAESFQHMVAQCDTPAGTSQVSDADAHVQTCDISNILTTCSHLDADLAAAPSMDALCGSPCVHLVVSSFDACRSDPSPEVRQQFDTEQWQPVVLQCQQLMSSGSASQDDHCTDTMETVLANVNHVCCAGGCLAPPKSCSSSCADAFMPVRCVTPLCTTNRAYMYTYVCCLVAVLCRVWPHSRCYGWRVGFATAWIVPDV
eukprot:COSAG02_NODE_3389_length_6827_cov_2.578627_4_plen_673_part_00